MSDEQPWSDVVEEDSKKEETSKSEQSEMEEAVSLLNEMRQHQKEAKKRRKNQHEEVVDNVEDLKEKGEEIHEEIERFNRTIPLPAYTAIIFGLFLIGHSILFGSDFIYLAAGVGMVAIGVSAIVESKIRGERKR